MKHLLMAGAALAIVAALTATPASANLIANGTFVVPGVGTGYGIFPNGSVPGWSSNNNETEIDYQTVVMPTFYLGIPGQSMELNGYQPDAISQTVTGLTVGQNYLLTWGYGDRPGGGGPYEAQVSFGGNLVTTDYGTDSGLWSSNSFLVTATATSEILTFAGIEDGSDPSYGNEIADVSLSPIPEPISLAVLGVGMAGLGMLRRRKRA